MKYLVGKYTSEEESKEVVNNLMANGISAYRQGLSVYMDDGGEDYGV